MNDKLRTLLMGIDDLLKENPTDLSIEEIIRLCGTTETVWTNLTEQK